MVRANGGGALLVANVGLLLAATVMEELPDREAAPTNSRSAMVLQRRNLAEQLEWGDFADERMISAKTTEEEHEFTRVDQVEAIVVDVLVLWLVWKARAPEPGWENTQMGSQERVEGLKFLASLVQVKKDWRLSVASTPEYAALRLAQFDLKWGEGHRRRTSRARYVVDHFDQLLEIFSNNWALEKPIPDRFRLAPLQELSTPELSLLRNILGRGWQFSVFIPDDVGWHACDLMWVAPQNRSLRSF